MKGSDKQLQFRRIENVDVLFFAIGVALAFANVVTELQTAGVQHLHQFWNDDLLC